MLVFSVFEIDLFINEDDIAEEEYSVAVKRPTTGFSFAL